MRTVLEIDRSKVCSPGPTIGLRGEVPYVVLRENASVLNQRVGVRSSMIGVWPGTRLGRGHSASSFQVSPLCRTLTGNPLAIVITPPMDQPPAISPVAPLSCLPERISHT